MQYVDRHPYPAHVSFDGGSLDCGSGLLLLIRKHIDPLAAGDLLEILSTEPSVAEDLPAWCRLTRNELISCVRQETQTSYLVRKGPVPVPTATSARAVEQSASGGHGPTSHASGIRSAPRAAHGPGEGTGPQFQSAARDELQETVKVRAAGPAVRGPVPTIRPLAVLGIGSWPRPRWLRETLHEHLSGRLSAAEFHETADDGVRLAVEAQLRAGVDVVTDGEQRRDNYASFVGGLLDNCQLIPLADLLAYVDDPDKFAAELKTLDVPADQVRHPAVFGRLRRSVPLAVHELRFVQSLTDRPVKIALPGPYLLTRTMWLECVSDRAYATREELADDIVTVLREELAELLAAGAAMVQLDEPVLTEVVFGSTSRKRSFMCGVLGGKRRTASELDFAAQLINRVVAGFPREQTALHICRGNWSPDESVALSGDYRPLVVLLRNVQVGTRFLELCTPRAGEMEVLKKLPEDCRIGVGVVNQKSPTVEPVDAIVARAQHAIDLFGVHRVLLNPDCGFATFADNPVSSASIAEQKLAAMVTASRQLRRRHCVAS